MTMLDISLKLPLKDPVPIFSLVLFIVLLAPAVLSIMNGLNSMGGK